MLARSRRADAISIAGIDLSQPAMPTKPSRRSANTTVSTESQLTSRLTSEPRMPSWPIEIPSDTVIVPNSRATPPASRMPALTSSASGRSVMLHGVISFHELAMPICGFSQSSSVNPIARSIARAGRLRLAVGDVPGAGLDVDRLLSAHASEGSHRVTPRPRCGT